MQISRGSFEDGEIVRRGRVIFKLLLQPREGISEKTYTISGKTSYQLCTEGETLTCYPPVWKDFSLDVTVSDGKPVFNEKAEALNAEFTVKNAESGYSLEDRLERALSQGSFFALIFVFIGGFLTSLTPCVYPMIPITIGYIGGRSAGQGKMKGFVLSLFFVLGLALVYSILGIFAALTGSLFGAITQTPIVLVIVAAIFALMGISMLGFFDISLPASLTSRLQSGGPRKGFIGAIIMGMVSGLVAAPCAGPVIVVLMAFIATTKNILLGFGLMMSFALGMGMLFIAIGTFSGLVTSLPQAGGWMDKIKKFFGVILLAAAVWFIRPLLPPFLFGIILGLGSIMLGTALGAFYPVKTDSTAGEKYGKAAGITLIVTGIYMIISLIPVPGRVVPDISGTPVAQESGIDWKTDISGALDQAKNENRKVIVDFTADWCTACRELEHKTFMDSTVRDKLNDYILVRVDSTDSRNPEVKKIHNKYDVKGLPTVLLLDSEGNEISRFVSFIPPDQFLDFLDQKHD